MANADHPLYYVWQAMRARCNNPGATAYNHYGGRGIRVCARWDDFHVFAADMGDRPEGYTLDRVDVNGDYSPLNCRWASRKEQQRNMRCNSWVTIDGISYKVVELADQSGLKTDTIKARVKQGLSYSEVVSPIRRVSSAGIIKANRNSAIARSTKTHCKHGHEYTPENTGKQRGGRFCKACFRVSKARYLQRVKETSGQK